MLLFITSCSARTLQEFQPGNGNVTLSLALLHSLLDNVNQAVVYMDDLIMRKPLQSDLIITLCEIYYSELRQSLIAD